MRNLFGAILIAVLAFGLAANTSAQINTDVDLVYVSFDIDVLDNSYAPGVGSAPPTGITPNEIFQAA